MKFQLTDVNNFYALVVFEEFQRYGDVFEFLIAKLWPLVVLDEPLSGQDFDEGDQPESVGQVRIEIGDVFIDRLEVFIDPSREAVLLDQLPRRVAC